ncbi:speckle-type POZ protein-like [Dreissena polymorpha]|uniref:BTB domain-containing protein n=1 Tax=Dreissena polymorpha TaxID=45954 RepID=A0A9D4LP08_DREPO|nr:speckle-type POZ protein-like [Dreissena polymorpha]KAH3862058.1 hypothetical protein DPMN_025017 [Dreissena polymorpha]
MASESTASMASRGDVISQWVHRVNRFSSQYDPSSWNADQVTGPPKVYPKYGDIVGTWAQGTRNSDEYIEVEFEEAVYVTGLEIYETYHAGGVKAVKGREQEGAWHTLYTASRIENIQSSRVFTPQLESLNIRIKQLRIEVDCTICGSWVEIDAVKLLGKRFLTAPPPTLESLAADMATIVNAQRFSDCSFLVEGRKVFGHRNILCARSDYFRALFKDDMKEGLSQDPIEMKDVAYDSFIGMLHFLYTNSVPDMFTTVELTNLWRVADRFNMDSLKAMVTYSVSLKIDVSNVVETYVCATDTLPLIDDIKNICLSFMSGNMAHVVKTSSFEKLPREIMLEIIQTTTSKLSLS